MAKGAVARETVFALRRQIAKIEGTLPEHLETPAGADNAGRNGVLLTGAERLDAALGGGLPQAALTEIHGAETRDAGAVAGFMLALVSLMLKACEAAAPILWIGTTEIFREAGFPYARGLRAMFGIEPETLLFCEAKKLVDALWIAEEAVRLTEPAATVLEVHANPRQLDLTATRRLHARAREVGRPLFLLRQAAIAEPTAAPVRLIVEPASSVLRETIGGPLPGSIGQPALSITIGKGNIARSGQFILEWNPDERIFKERRGQEKRTKDTVPVVPLSRHRTDTAATPGAVVAFRRDKGLQAVGDQLPRQERPAHRGPRRAG